MQGLHSNNAKDKAMTVNVRHDVPKTPITPQHGLLVGNAPRKLNSLGKYLASAISVNVIFLHVCLPAQSLLTGRKAMALCQVVLLRTKAVLVISEWCGHRHGREGDHVFLLIYHEFGLFDQPLVRPFSLCRCVVGVH